MVANTDWVCDLVCTIWLNMCTVCNVNRATVNTGVSYTIVLFSCLCALPHTFNECPRREGSLVTRRAQHHHLRRTWMQKKKVCWMCGGEAKLLKGSYLLWKSQHNMDCQFKWQFHSYLDLLLLLHNGFVETMLSVEANNAFLNAFHFKLMVCKAFTVCSSSGQCDAFGRDITNFPN